LKRIDESKLLIQLVTRLSALLARQRGLPVVIGIVLVIVSFLLQVVDVFAPSQVLNLLGVIAQHTGILIALIGLVVVTPLGK
jgi:hypothetical protein